MRAVNALKTRFLSGGLTKWVHLVLVACLTIALTSGCHKQGGGSADEGIVPTDPQVAANLADLTRQLRRALPRLNRSDSFDNFVAVAQVEVPPPPSGQKYAISKKWKVILVEAK